MTTSAQETPALPGKWQIEGALLYVLGHDGANYVSAWVQDGRNRTPVERIAADLFRAANDVPGQFAALPGPWQVEGATLYVLGEDGANYVSLQVQDGRHRAPVERIAADLARVANAHRVQVVPVTAADADRASADIPS